MKAAIYLRVSTEEQRERQSIATQRDFAERYCALHEIPVHDFYADDGVTGTIPLEQREQGARLLDDARAKKFDTVLIFKLDRLGRDPRLILNAVKELEDLGVQVKSMTEPFDTSTPSGRFLLTILSGVAGLERENILERSREGINRLVREGAWAGGIVPYGYRVEGQRREARLVVSEELVPGTGLTEADVIRMVYRMAADEGKSCIVIAEHLNRLGIAPLYARDGKQVLRGKRKHATAGIWRAGRVRHLLVNPTYRGLHEFGKRAKRPRPLIARSVPAIVDEAIWNRAQQTLRRNLLFSVRNARRQYLLRGLIKCAHCGLTYVGNFRPSARDNQRSYYICNGRHRGRAFFGKEEIRCRSKQVSSDLEGVVWREVEGFLRDPGPVLQELAEKLKVVQKGSATLESELAALRGAMAGKDEERNRVIGLFRRGKIDEPTLDHQLDEIERERACLRDEIAELETEGTMARETQDRLRSTEDLLRELGRRLDEPRPWELKRQLIETLVEGIRVETIGEGAQRDIHVTVTYRFAVPDGPITTHTPAPSATITRSSADLGRKCSG